MKIVLTNEEVKKIILVTINQDFCTNFTDVTFDGYSSDGFCQAVVEQAMPTTINGGDDLLPKA